MTTPAWEADVMELRVVSGLQAGAALPLEEVLTVGAGNDADLLLMGDGPAPARLLVRATPDGDLLLEAVEDGVVLSNGVTLAGGQTVSLAPGEAFRTGDIWLVVRGSSEPWETWTPPLIEALVIESPETTPQAHALQIPGPSLEPTPALVADVRPAGTRRRHAALGPRPMRTLGSLIVAAGLLSTMLGVAALVRQVQDSETAIEPDDETRKKQLPAADPRRKQRSSGDDPRPAPEPGSAAVSASAIPTASPSASASVPASASASGSASASASASTTIEAMLAAPAERRGGRGRLQVNIPGDGSLVLPFDIQEVMLGSSSHVTLTDGRRIEPGDRVGDWRLAEIRPGTLVFDGPRKVQIGW